MVSNIHLHNLLLHDILLSLNTLGRYSCHHILRELNEKADALSKEALELPSGACGIYEYIEGEELVSMEFQL
jgi:hypothetical protein